MNDLQKGDRVVTVGQSVPLGLRGEKGVVKEIDEDRFRPVVVTMEGDFPEDTRHSIISFDPRELHKINR